MSSYLTPMDWAERLRWTRHLMSRAATTPGSRGAWIRSSVPATGDLSSTPTGAVGSERAPKADGSSRPLIDRRELRRRQLSVLGLTESAGPDQIAAAHQRLVSDLTPSPNASHRRVDLALAMLEEVDQAYRWLKFSAAV